MSTTRTTETLSLLGIDPTSVDPGMAWQAVIEMAKDEILAVIAGSEEDSNGALTRLWNRLDGAQKSLSESSRAAGDVGIGAERHPSAPTSAGDASSAAALDAEERAGKEYCAELAGEHLVKLCDQLGEELVNAHEGGRETEALLRMLTRVWQMRWQLGLFEDVVHYGAKRTGVIVIPPEDPES